jgi:beta-galactosidase
MNYRITIILLILAGFVNQGYAQMTRHEMLFDEGWKFCLGDMEGAEKPEFNDTSWRNIDLPHDWSIEKLPGQVPGEVVGPFSKESPGRTATGYTLGGTGWYRKTFTLSSQKSYSKTIIDFDGVYMNCDVWVNGKLVGSHPYGYTAFHFDITDFLNPTGKPNVIAVKVKNEGKNSRWYSGSGIYRHVWLVQKQAVCVSHQGV